MTNSATKNVAPDCRRCGGSGVLKQFPHVAAGVCFRCWGCGSDLPDMGKALQDRVVALRREYRAAVRSGAAQDVLDAIVKRGKAAANRVLRHQNMVRGLHSAAQPPAL